MNVVVFDEGKYDIAVSSPKHGQVNYLAVKEPIQINTEPVKVGIYTFIPGSIYNRFGSKHKTSSGFNHVSVKEPSGLLYIGQHDQRLLFRHSVGGVADIPTLFDDYKDIYITWKVLDSDNLFFLSYGGVGRIIEMNQ